MEEQTIHIGSLGFCVARSQARELLSKYIDCKVIKIDFEGVDMIGQAFADEVFRVFKIKHPEIEIVPINMNKTVEFMVGRVEKV